MECYISHTWGLLYGNMKNWILGYYLENSASQVSKGQIMSCKKLMENMKSAQNASRIKRQVDALEIYYISSELDSLSTSLGKFDDLLNECSRLNDFNNEMLISHLSLSFGYNSVTKLSHPASYSQDSVFRYYSAKALLHMKNAIEGINTSLIANTVERIAVIEEFEVNFGIRPHVSNPNKKTLRLSRFGCLANNWTELPKDSTVEIAIVQLHNEIKSGLTNWLLQIVIAIENVISHSSNSARKLCIVIRFNGSCTHHHDNEHHIMNHTLSKGNIISDDKLCMEIALNLACTLTSCRQYAISYNRGDLINTFDIITRRCLESLFARTKSWTPKHPNSYTIPSSIIPSDLQLKMKILVHKIWVGKESYWPYKSPNVYLRSAISFLYFDDYYAAHRIKLNFNAHLICTFTKNHELALREGVILLGQLINTIPFDHSKHPETWEATLSIFELLISIVVSQSAKSFLLPKSWLVKLVKQFPNISTIVGLNPEMEKIRKTLLEMLDSVKRTERFGDHVRHANASIVLQQFRTPVFESSKSWDKLSLEFNIPSAINGKSLLGFVRKVTDVLGDKLILICNEDTVNSHSKWYKAVSPECHETITITAKQILSTIPSLNPNIVANSKLRVEAPEFIPGSATLVEPEEELFPTTSILSKDQALSRISSWIGKWKVKQSKRDSGNLFNYILLNISKMWDLTQQHAREYKCLFLGYGYSYLLQIMKALERLDHLEKLYQQQNLNDDEEFDVLDTLREWNSKLESVRLFYEISNTEHLRYSREGLDLHFKKTAHILESVDDFVQMEEAGHKEKMKGISIEDQKMKGISIEDQKMKGSVTPRLIEAHNEDVLLEEEIYELRVASKHKKGGKGKKGFKNW
jgi:hypothetical protein